MSIRVVYIKMDNLSLEAELDTDFPSWRKGDVWPAYWYAAQGAWDHFTLAMSKIQLTYSIADELTMMILAANNADVLRTHLEVLSPSSEVLAEIDNDDLLSVILFPGKVSRQILEQIAKRMLSFAAIRQSSHLELLKTLAGDTSSLFPCIWLREQIPKLARMRALLANEKITPELLNFIAHDSNPVLVLQAAEMIGLHHLKHLRISPANSEMFKRWVKEFCNTLT